MLQSTFAVVKVSACLPVEHRTGWVYGLRLFSQSVSSSSRPNPRVLPITRSARHRLERPDKLKESGLPHGSPGRRSDTESRSPIIKAPRPIPYAARTSRFTPLAPNPPDSPPHFNPSEPKPKKQQWWQDENTAYVPTKLRPASANPPSSIPKRNMPRPELHDLRRFPTPSPGKQQDSEPFQDSPLLPGLITCLQETLGRNAKPTPIQQLSINHFLTDSKSSTPSFVPISPVLLASETGSGKSIAYLLPLIQRLKQTEKPLSHLKELQFQKPNLRHPRALVLAPTHELARQLTGFAKKICHVEKLRIDCTSNPTSSTSRTSRDQGPSARRMKTNMDEMFMAAGQEAGNHGADVLVGTPSKIANIIGLKVETSDESPAAAARLTKTTQVWTGIPEISLEAVEWVVVDEADVLFDRDFRQTVEAIIQAVQIQRQTFLLANPEESAYRYLDVLEDPQPSSTLTEEHSPLISPYPFYNLILTTATVPASLNTYLNNNFPSLKRLFSANIHRLPPRLQLERVDVSGGNPKAVIHKKILEIFAEDARRGGIRRAGTGEVTNAQLVMFVNRTSRAEELGQFLEEKGVKCLVVTGGAAFRQKFKGSNGHLDAFLNPWKESARVPINPHPDDATQSAQDQPRLLITTSLLARGLDFAPTVTHVLIADEPRDEIDFLHRAGRTGRAGRHGTVVVFVKGKPNASAARKFGLGSA